MIFYLQMDVHLVEIKENIGKKISTKELT